MSPAPTRLRTGYTLTEAYRLVRGAERRVVDWSDTEPAPTENTISSGAPSSVDPSTKNEPRRCA
jgi:hypothetical protein